MFAIQDSQDLPAINVQQTIMLILLANNVSLQQHVMVVELAMETETVFVMLDILEQIVNNAQRIIILIQLVNTVFLQLRVLIKEAVMV